MSIDDFGTGFSSLKYLRDLPIHELKVDRTFVAGLGADRRDTLIVKSVVALGRAFGFRVVAEGVTHDALWGHVLDLECRYGQGFAIGRPMPADQFLDWYEGWVGAANRAQHRFERAARISAIP